MIALTLLAYVVVVRFVEAIRDVAYANLEIAQVLDALLKRLPVDANAHPKCLFYSGLFVMLKQKLCLSSNQLNAIAKAAVSAFGVLFYGNVRTFV